MATERTGGRDAPAVRPGTLLTIGALGIVFGDIGTSPLYALQESLQSTDHSVALDRTNILGILSLIAWSLIIVITVKYLLFVMRADNNGEGGILALTSLVPEQHGRSRWRKPDVRRAPALILFGLFGTALLYGDGIITPAISVLSAVEGTELVSPSLASWEVPIAVVILVALFAFQPRGTGSIGRVFGPVMAVWFCTIAAMGLSHIVQRPEVLDALNPGHGLAFFQRNGWQGFLTLGSVCLVVTGGEALYADMGHFGRRPIRTGWYVFVLPALLLNYFGQGALLLGDPSAIDNPFYRLAPQTLLIPLVVLATFATVIASQALIAGAYSLTMQASQLGYLPRVRVTHTSRTQEGQIYLPGVNWALMIACIIVVLFFRSSQNLAAAYGLAVTGTMSLTTIIFYVVARDRLKMNKTLVTAACALFLAVELAFLAANLFKIPYGGWFPLVVAAVIFSCLTTWFTGRKLLTARTMKQRHKLDEFVASITENPPARVPGAAVYLYGRVGFTPMALVVNTQHNESLHELVVVMSIVTDDVPVVDDAQRVEVTDHGHGFFKVIAHFGFSEQPDVPAALRGLRFGAIGLDLEHITYYVSRETVRVSDRPGMARWREHLFSVMARNSAPASTYFKLPDAQTVEVGTPIAL